MKRIKLVCNILRKMNVDKIAMSFFFLIIILAFILSIFEPGISNIWDGMWYCFVSFTTIGFGDIVGVTVIGKIIIAILMIIGRLGPITISIALFKRNNKEKNENVATYPKGNIIVG